MKPIRLAVATITLLSLLATANADKFRFIVAGDGRSDPSANPPRPEDVNGVNTLITTEIRDAVLKEKARFLMWTGDLALGSKDDGPLFEKQLMTWRTLMEPLYQKKITVLACRGNHESRSTVSAQVWNKVFSGKYAMPGNGPDGEKNLTFSKTFGSVLAIGLDQYSGSGRFVNQQWLDKVLKGNKKPFVFAMGHEPAFMDGAHKDNMDNAPEKRDQFWESLIAAGSRVFFAGHDHLYDHMIVTRTGSNPGPVMHQIVAGTAGAPFYAQGEYAGNNTVYSLERKAHIDKTYGYILVEIDGNKATITFKGRTSPGVYTPMDTFSYTADQLRK